MGVRTAFYRDRAFRNSTLGAEMDAVSAGATRLDALTDVSVAEGSGINNYVLYWNNGASKWEALSPSGLVTILTPYLPSGGSTTLQALTDVNVTEGVGIDGYSLVWNNATSKWIASNISGGAGGSGLGVALGKLYLVDNTGTNYIASYDTTAGSIITGSASYGPTPPGGLAHSPVVTMPAGASYAQVTVGIYTTNTFTGHIVARLVRYQAGLPSPLAAASSSYDNNESNQYVTFISDGGSGNYWEVTTNSKVVAGDMFCLDFVSTSGAPTIYIGSIAAIVWGTGSNFRGGGGGGGSTTLAGLSDVITSGEIAGDSLVYNGTNYSFVYIPTLYETSGAPSGGLGRNGDFAIDPTTGIFYSKSGGTWTGITFPAGSGTFMGVSFNALTGTVSGGYDVGWGTGPQYPVPSGVTKVLVTAQATVRIISAGGSASAQFSLQQYNNAGVPQSYLGSTVTQTFTEAGGTGSQNFSFSFSTMTTVAAGDYFAFPATAGITFISSAIQVMKLA